MAQWRVSFDVPVPYSTEPGLIRTVHCADFRGEGTDQQNTYHEPTTGLVMLKPGHLNRSFSGDFKGLSNWNYKASFWQQSNRAIDANGVGAPSLTSVRPAATDPTLIQLLVSTAIIAINASPSTDTLLWGLQSTFTLAADEGFCIHYHGITDELLRFENWFGVQWADVFLHVSQTGIARVYQYPRNSDTTINLTATPTLVDCFEFATPGDLVGSQGHIWVQPIPGYGILFSHSRTSQSTNLLSSNTNTSTVRGHLISWPTRSLAAGPTVCDSSVVSVGVNPHSVIGLLGWQSIRFPASGSFVDAILDPGYTPSHLPSLVSTLIVTTIGSVAAQTAASATLIKPNSTAAWAVGDRQGRVSIALTTTNNIRTPFLQGHAVAWPPVFTTRSTTQVFPAAQKSLEFTENEDGRFDGKASVIMETDAQRKIIERGDTTWLLERSLDHGVTWTTYNGGIASVDSAEAFIDSRGFYYDASLTLHDNNERLRETHVYVQAAFDGVVLQTAFNVVLQGAGFSNLASVPSDFVSLTLPPAGYAQGWNFSPRVSDDGEHSVDLFLLIARRQNVEYRLIYDWPTQLWHIDNKPRDTSVAGTWTLTAFSDELPAAQTAVYQSLVIYPSPPEANIVTAAGVTSTSARVAIVVRSAPAINTASLTDATSPDYLGRFKSEEYQVDSLYDQTEVNKMARRIYDAVSHRRLKAKLISPSYQSGLIPCTQVNVRAQNAAGVRTTLFTAWIKKRTIEVADFDQELITYDLDTVWESEISA